MSAVHWQLLNGATWDMLGLLPQFINGADHRGIVEQLNEAYAHGGGWNEFEGFEVIKAPRISDWRLTYPGDPAYVPIAMVTIADRQEIGLLWDHEWMTVHQIDGTFRAARMD